MKIDLIEQLQPGMLIQLCKDPLGFWSWPTREDTIEVLVVQPAHEHPDGPNREFVSVLWGEDMYYLSIAGTMRGRTNWVISSSYSDKHPKTWVYAINLLRNIP